MFNAGDRGFSMVVVAIPVSGSVIMSSAGHMINQPGRVGIESSVDAILCSSSEGNGTLIAHSFGLELAERSVRRARAIDRPLDDLKKFSTTIASNINDLPATRPHGSDFGYHAQTLELHLV